jgi:hypothetical protein
VTTLLRRNDDDGFRVQWKVVGAISTLLIGFVSFLWTTRATAVEARALAIEIKTNGSDQLSRSTQLIIDRITALQLAEERRHTETIERLTRVETKVATQK